ncbi:ABC transporter substrate-binding protein [Lachnospiraceae bacterium C1.1]|nr:ABC transporter substrate-binding protein [Lachnospiraceae bacterium C1.1]
MKRKLISMIMTVTMAGALLAGCGSASSAPAASEAAPAASEAAASEAAPAASTEAAASEAAPAGSEAASTETADTAASGELIKVGIINNDPNESGYRTANDKDLKAFFTEENGYEASFAYSLKNDEQITAAQKFIQDGVDYLLLSAADTAGWDSVLQDAQDAGISVLLFDRTIDADESLYDASIVSDMAKEGETAVSWLADQGLDEYNIIHLQGVMGSAAQQGRTGALDDKVAAEDSWNLVTQQTAEWNAEKAQQIVQSVIDSGEKFNVIYAENDDMAKGAVAALDKANISHGVGKDVIVMGFDCNKWALEELLNQNWNYDGQCNPFQATYLDECIKTIEAGGTVDPKTIIMEEKGFDATTITQEDVDNYGI